MNFKYVSNYILFLSGLFSFIYYLYNLLYENNVNINILYLSVIILSSSLVLILFQKNENGFILALFLSSFFVLSWELIRFGLIQGTDIMMEINVAMRTEYWNSWISQMATRRTGSVLSVTILPTMISKITGMSILFIFQIIFFIISSFLPLILYFLIKELTGSMTLSGLSSIIFIFDYEKLSLGPNAMRENIAKILLFTTLYFFYKKQDIKNYEYRRGFSIIMIFTLFGLLFSHYTVALFFLFILMLLYFMNSFYMRKILTRITNGMITSHFKFIFGELIILSFLFVFTWWIFITYPLFVRILNIIKNIVLENLGITPPHFHPYTQYAVTFPRGELLSIIILWIYRFLIIIGMFLNLWKTKKYRLQTFSLVGFVMLAILGVWFVAPHFSRELHIDRVYSFGLPFFSYFAAISIQKIMTLLSNQIKNLSFFKEFHILNQSLKHLIPCILVSIFFLNHILILPSFYYLPKKASSYEELIVARSYEMKDIEFCNWIDQYTPINARFVGDKRSREILKWLLYTPKDTLNYTFRTNFPQSIIGSKITVSDAYENYYFFLDYVIQKDVFIETELRIRAINNASIHKTPSGRVIVTDPKLRDSLIQPGVNLIYVNDHDYLFHTKMVLDPISYENDIS